VLNKYCNFLCLTLIDLHFPSLDVTHLRIEAVCYSIMQTVISRDEEKYLRKTFNWVVLKKRCEPNWYELLHRNDMMLKNRIL
jgi:hypothetical protein